MSTFDNRNHPERLEDEIFLGNCYIDHPRSVEEIDLSFQGIGWVSKRKGTVAYSETGEIITKGWDGAGPPFPAFVKQDEFRKKLGPTRLAEKLPKPLPKT